MNVRLVAGLFVLTLSATAGCGDDDGVGGDGGAGGTAATSSGAGASGATSTSSGGGAEPTGTGGSGGSGGSGGAEPTGTGGSGGAEPTGTGGSGGSGGAEPTGTGGSGGGTSIVYGAACTNDAACSGEYCVTEADWGWPAGSCAGLCDPVVGTCDEGGVCVDFGEGLGLCIRRCDTSEECRDGYKCSDIGGEITACIPGCTDNAQCAGRRVCDRIDGTCKIGERDCSDGEDDEGDDRVDCADSDCAATCGPLVDAACAGAAPVTTTIEGDTSRGTRVLEGSCTGAGPEEIHLFTPPAGQSGTLRVVLQSESNHGLYVRAACADASTELACEDDHAASDAEPEEEELEIVVRKDQAVPIVVDARTRADAGPYTLDLVFSPATCGDGIVSPPEQCDDGNTVDGDGCSAACTVEIDDVCADAPVAVLGDNRGDTTGGTMLFEGTCIGPGTPERIHTFTPPSDGTLRLLLSSATDQGFYVRTGCSGTQLACVDDVIGGEIERRSIAVEGGVPLFIFVEAYLRPYVGPYTLNLTFTPSP
ncbi:myxococcus cysteine-rich repeat containing protein [Sorangium sp. So ce134]